MRKLIIWGALLLAIACAGKAARQNVLIPTMRNAWGGIVDNIDAGAPSGVELAARDERGAALRAGDIERIVGAGWAGLKVAALRGIDAMLVAGTIGPGVAESLRERVRMFGEALEGLR